MGVLLELDNLKRLLEGFETTLLIALSSAIVSIVVGMLLGSLMAFGSKIMVLACRVYLESIRIIPLLAWLFIVYFGLASWFDLHISAVLASVIVFSLWGGAEMMDLTRGVLTSVSKHQVESALALGLDSKKVIFNIIFPQSFLSLLPSSLNLFTRMIKTTALVSLIGAIDLLKVGQQIIELNLLRMPNASFVVYGVILMFYFSLCYSLSLYSSCLEKKFQYIRG
ncbi:amino ABC transporter, permease, 3-TM region, His/Glu/Gln/Arg/opine family domain protein [Helicobacter pylori Hp P-8b]|uniref:amino acid ABC transporter permease n=1 Tax=Helicobacter pylori TaxID=210 RepID=UPI00026A0327|nr:amino acid ABC transporter permease [Helicobacter pylori]EJB55616.1 glutamine ABC transporter permease protein [Helicobacter pylori Hp H-29]EJC01767.1 glutamine ABC transporter permease protein [Helicobacter pylori Hp P-8]EJC26704.1 amino ABC transporter, permease, 3-TM region, His/Glu/Gln/Arg/opine family domain protein [Helicobacter pylori Hp P-8b]WQV44069.1 amino acid ABC transporter permease [Helicobacter pylori]